MTAYEKRRITVAQKRVADEKRMFEELMAEARKWSDQNLWTVAEGWFRKAAVKAKDVAFAQEDLGRLLVTEEMKKETVIP
jgi:hypothetical protein